MEAALSDLTQIAVVILVAVALGLLLVRLRQPPMVGYILTGIVLGPTAFGLASQTESIELLAEIGVLLLLFLIGMELSLRAFMMVLRPALMTAGLQIIASLAVTFAFGALAGWTVQASILLGFAVAVSSTALVIKMLEDIGELRSELGRITIGVLIAQDLAIVPILLLSESLGTGRTLDFWLVAKMTVAIGGLFALVWALGRPGKIVLPFSDRIAGKPDLLTLSMLAVCLAGAAASGLFGLSPVYGAFVAGLIVGQSTLRAEAIPATHPVQSLLIVIFFLSIGLLIDLEFIAENWALLLAFVAGIILLKSVLNVVILRFVGERWETAFPAGIIMSQIGEFSFVIAAVGLSANVIDYSAYQTAIAVIAVSLLISPFWLVTVRRFHEVAQKGVASFRLALAEVYEDEIAEFEKGAAGLRRAARQTRRWGRAAKHAAVRRSEAIAPRQREAEAEPEADTQVAADAKADAATMAAETVAGTEPPTQAEPAGSSGETSQGDAAEPDVPPRPEASLAEADGEPQPVPDGRPPETGADKDREAQPAAEDEERAPDSAPDGDRREAVRES